MTEKETLTALLERIGNTISDIVEHPLMYVGGEAHLHTAEVMVRMLLGLQDEAMGASPLDPYEERAYLYRKYPEIKGPVRCIASGSRSQGLDFSAELLEYVSWRTSMRKPISNECS